MEFTYEPDDLREVRQVAARQRGRGRARARRGVLGWVVFIGLALVLIDLLQHRQQAGRGRPVVPPPAPQGSTALWSVIIPVIPWVVVVAFIYLVVYRQVRAKRNAVPGQRVEVTIGDDGVTMVDGPVQTRWGWDAFDDLVETHRQFLLRVTSDQSWLALPKRAISPAELAPARDLIRSGVGVAGGAFPVLPVPPA